MTKWIEVAYSYDGTFDGFLSCVFGSFLYQEAPVCFLGPEEGQASLWPERIVETNQDHAKQVYRALALKLGVMGRQMVKRGFLTCLPQRELHLWRFIHLGYERGRAVVHDLAEERVSVLVRAVRGLEQEAHKYKGFVRFSQQKGILAAEIEPKNRVLPLLRHHFCTRFAGECFAIHDRTHKEALFYQGGKWAIVPVDRFQIGDPNEDELDYRQLWRRFYNVIAIEGRYNPRCRMSNMPKRYWSCLTEFQSDEVGKNLASDP